MANYLKPEDVAKEAIARGVAKFWSSRIREMADHAATASGQIHGDRTVQGLKVLSVASTFPLKGTIEVEREDGRRFSFRNSPALGFLITEHPRVK